MHTANYIDSHIHACAPLCKNCGKTRCYAASFGQPEVRSLLFKSSLFFPRLSQSRATPPSEIRKLSLTVRRILISRNFSLRQHAFGTQQTAESQQPCTRFEQGGYCIARGRGFKQNEHKSMNVRICWPGKQLHRAGKERQKPASDVHGGWTQRGIRHASATERRLKYRPGGTQENWVKML